MNKYKTGQLVRAAWPDGTSAMEGLIDLSPKYKGGSALVHHNGHSAIEWLVQQGATITILKEPPVKPPTGIGAVVVAASETYPNSRRHYVLTPSSLSGALRWTSGRGHADWNDLIDPEVLSEGVETAW